MARITVSGARYIEPLVGTKRGSGLCRKRHYTKQGFVEICLTYRILFYLDPAWSARSAVETIPSHNLVTSVLCLINVFESFMGI